MFTLVTLKSIVSKNEVLQLGEPRHTQLVYCGRYTRITSENTKVYLSKNGLPQLMDLASACIDRKLNKFCWLQDELVQWQVK